MFADFLSISLPAIIKAVSDGGRRKIEVQASSEDVDSEEDVILQTALLGSADEFLTNGFIDVDHLAELGDRFGIEDPSSYIVGRPTSVKNAGMGCTSVEGVLNDSPRADSIWNGLTADPPETWYASVYGFPELGGFLDCRTVPAGVETYGAKRFLVTKMRWKSLALCRHPINTSLTESARIIKGERLLEIVKARIPGGQVERYSGPMNRADLLRHAEAVEREGLGLSVFTLKQHFIGKCHMDEDQADVAALATAHLVARRLSRAA